MRRLLLTLAILCAAATQASADSLPDDAAFRALLKAAKLTWTPTPGFHPVPIHPNEAMGYDFAVKLDKPKLEIRYAVRFNTQAPPPATLADPKVHVATVPRSGMFPGLVQVTVLNLAGGGDSELVPFPPEAVLREFGTEEGFTTSFLPLADGWKGYKKCLMIALRKDGASEAYVFFLFDAFKKVSPVIERTMHTLRLDLPQQAAPDGGQ